MRRCERLDDDSLPCLYLRTGTEIFAEALGCEVCYPDNSNPSALPLVTSSAEVSSVTVPEVFDSTLAYLFEMADGLRSLAGGPALLRPVDIQSPMDIASLVWDRNDFYPAMIHDRVAVRELAEKAYLMLTASMDEWFRGYGPEFVSHCPDYHMPYGLTVEAI